MILAFDTYYFENKAKTVALEFNHWTDKNPINVYEETISNIEEYIPGEFYKRELPCILSLLKQIDVSHCQAIIIDGFVVLDDHHNIGLGGYLHQALKERIPIIGVAKNDFIKIQNQKELCIEEKAKNHFLLQPKE